MAELNVSRENVSGLLSLNKPSTKGKYYVIPEYQRPYRWNRDTCDILWNDLLNFYQEHQNDGKEYFLGSIVTCSDSEDRRAINVIDGQQRITSLMLLLRAFYHKLENQLNNHSGDTNLVEGMMKKIGSCIWNTEEFTEKVIDKKVVHLKTLVATDDDKGDFEWILEKGEARDKSKSYYSQNYKFFLSCCDEYATNNLTGYQGILSFILDRCIVLPIECTDLDSALTIFGTLNNRGLPLSDSDIFKSELYKLHKSKQEFSEQWKELEQQVETAGFNLDDLFRYYMYVDRAKHNDREKEKGLRSYYSGAGNKYEIFHKQNFFEDLRDLGDFWTSIYKYQEDYCNNEGLKYIQCLIAYPNEYWKYPVSVFYHRNKGLDRIKFKDELSAYLKKLLAFIFVRFIEAPTVNKVRPYIFNFCIDTYNGKGIDCSSYNIPLDLKTRINDFASSRITRALLLLNTYLFDINQELLPKATDIEHILPQRWQTANYNEWEKNDAQIHLEMLGNKIIFEKTLNIQAGNGYFARKKEKYKESKIKEVLHLAASNPQSDWLKGDIEKRNEEVINRLCDFFQRNIN